VVSCIEQEGEPGFDTGRSAAEDLRADMASVVGGAIVGGLLSSLLSGDRP